MVKFGDTIACSKRCKKNFANSFKNKVSRVEQTDKQTNRQTDGQTDRLTLNFINIDITAGDILNSRLSIYVPKKVLVKKDAIDIKIVHGHELISRAKPGRSASNY